MRRDLYLCWKSARMVSKLSRLFFGHCKYFNLVELIKFIGLFDQTLISFQYCNSDGSQYGVGCPPGTEFDQKFE